MNIEKSIEILKTLKNYNKFYKEKNKDLTITITLEAKESIDKAIERLLTAYEKEKEKNKELENELEKHIKFCEQEAEGSLNNEVCHISLKFNKKLLNILKKEE